MRALRTLSALVPALTLLGAGLVLRPAFAAPGPDRWTWPVRDPVILRGYEPSVQPWGRGHRGTDFAAAEGDEVLAIGAGTVAFAGTIAGKPVVAVEHPGAGLRSTYEPAAASVSPGQQVQAGEVIATVAAGGGHCAGQCLHLGVRRSLEVGEGVRSYLDPLSLLRRWAILKPIPRRAHVGGPG